MLNKHGCATIIEDRPTRSFAPALGLLAWLAGFIKTLRTSSIDLSSSVVARLILWRRLSKEHLANRWTSQFISSRGNEYFCDIDEEYLTDRFNLTGLNTEVQYYTYALDLVTDVFDVDCEDEMREQIEKSARHLYGLVHARYITTNRGMNKMVTSLLL